jgi:hypothetical protein
MAEEPPPDNLPESLDDAEQRAKQVMESQLAEHLNLTLLATNTIAFILDQAPDLPIAKVTWSRKVVTVLLVRISNDVRAAGLLAWHGYPLQAASQIANCHESAFTVALIGSDNDIAQTWANHDDPTAVPFGKIKDITRKALQNLNVPNVDGQTDLEYVTYRQLCWAKHANPILQKSHGVELQKGDVVFFNGPDTSEGSIRLGSYALEHSAHLAYLALCSFAFNHLKSIPNHTLLTINQRLTTLGSKKHLLAESSIKRWGNADPFPGRWKT